jgi:hypothetical protein
LPAGVVVGPAFTSVFLSSFAGLDEGEAAGVAAGETLGEAATLGLAAGLIAGLTSGLFSGVFVHAPRLTAAAAKTVSRINLLIVFSFSKAAFRGSFRAVRSLPSAGPRWLRFAGRCRRHAAVENRRKNSSDNPASRRTSGAKKLAEKVFGIPGEISIAGPRF